MVAAANDLGADLEPSGEDYRGKDVCYGGDNPTALLVQPEKCRYWCFRCNEGGDLLDLRQDAKGFEDRTEALLDLAGTYGVEPTPLPGTFFAKLRRQAPIRDAIDEEKIRHMCNLLFALV
jgi:DNA primase